MEKIAASIARIAAESAARATAESHGAIPDLPADVMAGLAAWIEAQPEPRPNLSQAIGQGVAEWLRAQGYLPPASV